MAKNSPIETYGLNEKQLNFCREYVVDYNATNAAIRAGYSENSAESQGSRLLTNDKIKLVVDRLRRQKEERTQITADMVLTQISQMATYDTADLYYEDGRVKPLNEIPEHARRAIESIKNVTKTDKDGNKYQTVEYKMCPKPKMLELLGKHLSLFDERVVHDVADGVSFKMFFGSPDKDNNND